MSLEGNWTFSAQMDLRRLLLNIEATYAGDHLTYSKLQDVQNLISAGVVRWVASKECEMENKLEAHTDSQKDSGEPTDGLSRHLTVVRCFCSVPARRYCLRWDTALFALYGLVKSMVPRLKIEEAIVGFHLFGWWRGNSRSIQKCEFGVYEEKGRRTFIMRNLCELLESF